MAKQAHTTTAVAGNPFEQLSAALLQEVLQRVPQRERLGQCARVGSAWAEAAALATTDIEHDFETAAAATRLEACLEQRAGQLQRLKLAARQCHLSPPRLQLPWAQLTKLEVLSLCAIRVPAIQQSGSGGSSSAGRSASSSPALLPHLKDLQLTNCSLHSAACLQQLAKSTALTRLELSLHLGFTAYEGNHSWWWWQHLSAPDLQEIDSTIGSTLQQLQQQLVVLQLGGFPVSNAVLQPIAAMQHLQDLTLSVRGAAADSRLADLPSSLSCFYLCGHQTGTSLLPSQLTTQHTSLQHLELACTDLPPGILGSCLQLERLHLTGCELLPGGRQGAAELLRAVQQLTRLQSLQLKEMSVLAAVDQLQLYSALTASTQLTQLHLYGNHAQPLQRGAVQRMFPAGRQLPQLLQLRITITYDDTPFDQDGWCVDSCDLSSIVSCCPGLQQLDVSNVVRDDADVSPLLRLPQSCTMLEVGGSAFADTAAPVLAQLPQLADLCWLCSPSLTDTGLQQLTALTGLGSLWVSDCRSLSPHFCGDDYEVLELASSESQGPVWRQLDQLCEEKSLVCARARLQQHKAENARLHQQLAEKDARLAERDAQLAERDAQLAERDVQLAERDAQLAERDAQVQQLQEVAQLRDGR